MTCTLLTTLGTLLDDGHPRGVCAEPTLVLSVHLVTFNKLFTSESFWLATSPTSMARIFQLLCHIGSCHANALDQTIGARMT